MARVPVRLLAELLDIVSQPRSLSKATCPGTGVPPVERSDQQGYESLIRFRRSQSLERHMVPQHELFGVGMGVYLRAQPLRSRVLAVAIPSYGTGLKRQTWLDPTVWLLVVRSTLANRLLYESTEPAMLLRPTAGCH